MSLVIVFISCLCANSALAKLAATPAAFEQLPGWSKAKPLQSFKLFKRSCEKILKMPKNSSLAEGGVKSRAQDWFSACQAATKIEIMDDVAAKKFFEKYFKPVHFENSDGTPGKFTAYYLHEIPASLTKTKKYSVPIYGLPNGYEQIEFKNGLALGKKIAGGYQIFPYTRNDIDNGKIDAFTPILLWTDSRYSRYLLEVEGSGYAKLPKGKRILLNYAGKNGQKGELLYNLAIKSEFKQEIKNSRLSAEKWFLKYPQKVDQILKKIPSFIFFKIKKNNDVMGFQEVPLTPYYSIAVNHEVVPLGAPVWLTTTMPYYKVRHKSFNRLMVAQDIGSAIKGNVRADIFVGDNSELGTSMSSSGQYWVFFPKQMMS